MNGRMPDFSASFPDKARRNLNKHDVAFEDAELIWSDPFPLVAFDRIDDGEERWHAPGLSGGVVLLLVVNTYPGEGDAVIRIVSARKATKSERRASEDGDL